MQTGGKAHDTRGVTRRPARSNVDRSRRRRPKPRPGGSIKLERAGQHSVSTAQATAPSRDGAKSLTLLDEHDVPNSWFVGASLDADGSLGSARPARRARRPALLDRDRAVAGSVPDHEDSGQGQPKSIARVEGVEEVADLLEVVRAPVVASHDRSPGNRRVGMTHASNRSLRNWLLTTARPASTSMTVRVASE